MTLAQSLTAIIIFWAIIGGLGASLLLPSMQSLIHGNFEGAAQTQVYALVGAAAAIAAAVGPLLGGFITTYLSWRVGLRARGRDHRGRAVGHQARPGRAVHGRRARSTSSAPVLSVVGMGGIVLGILVWQEGGEAVGALHRGRRDRAGRARAVAASGASARGKPDAARPGPVPARTLFRLGITEQMLQQIALGGAMIALPIFLQMVLEYNALQAGLSLAPLSLSMFAVALLAGKRRGPAPPGGHHPAGFVLLVDRHGRC